MGKDERKGADLISETADKGAEKSASETEAEPAAGNAGSEATEFEAVSSESADAGKGETPAGSADAATEVSAAETQAETEGDGDGETPSGSGGWKKFAKFFGKKAKGKPWSKKKKVTVWSIVAGVLVAAIVISSLTVKFTMFNDEFYSVDLGAIRSGDPIFIDDFDTFDENIWYIDENLNDKGEITPRRGGWWAKEAVGVKDGNLVITTKKENGRWITGAVSALGTPGKEDENGKRGFSRTYGYYEAKCKLPKGYGIWSAFWFMPTTANFGKATSKDAAIWGSEIDVFEVPIWPENKVQQAVHVGGYEELHSSTFNPRWLTYDKIDDLYDRYHTYGLYWDANIYKFYIDGNCVWTTSYGNNVSKVDEYMIFSVEIGGEGGKLTESPWRFIGGKLINENPEGDYYQSEFCIDYVKVWDV